MKILDGILRLLNISLAHRELIRHLFLTGNNLEALRMEVLIEWSFATSAVQSAAAAPEKRPGTILNGIIFRRSQTPAQLINASINNNFSLAGSRKNLNILLWSSFTFHRD